VAKRYYWLLAVLVILYIVSIFVLKTDSATLARYHISDVQLKFLSLTIIIPAFAIWLAAFYSIVNTGKYAQKIKNTPHGEGFGHLANGVVIIGLGLPITSIVGRLLTYAVQQNAVSQAFSTIVSTHLTIVFYIVGFFFLYRGARLLAGSVRAKLSQRQVSGAIGALALISAFYAFATLSDPSRMAAHAPATTATYYMPDWLILLTVIIPYIVIWALGFFTTLLLATYYQKVGGAIYRAALVKLNFGFFVVILALIILQFITTVTTNLSGWGLSALLLLVYLLLAVIAIGYVLIALGAKGLAKLEEVI